MAKKSSNTSASKKKTKAKNNITSQDKNMKEEVKTEKQEVKEDIPAEDLQEEQVKAEDSTETEKEAVSEEVDKVAEAEAKAKEWHDKYLRLSAEFDNYRKRTLKEKSDLLRIGNEDLLKDILPVVDNFERGLATIDKSEDLKALKDGVHLIYNIFTEFLKQKGIKEIEAKNNEFDIDFHEAMTKIPAPSDDMKGKVVDVIEKGYTLNDKVIRYAKVVVGE